MLGDLLAGTRSSGQAVNAFATAFWLPVVAVALLPATNTASEASRAH
ncbi:hypothetical protein [Sinomonas sp. P10A9]|uniref:MFS transporter n=1 Tax=Sinomonas puerhi TaxID=3238584 RepID=A0AB39L5S6_9MICC